ncbi:MAG TPA: nicotinamide riboside transporter PnuC [Bacteroidales bacterium]|nr:nicotinamide riboside transporter PnuC [Bacteroidales bacterium]
MAVINWISGNYIEIFGALAGIIYVFLEIRQNLWLWPVGIATSAVYIIVFFTGKLYADMSLQGYYLIISILGWYWWLNGGKGDVDIKEKVLNVTHIKPKIIFILTLVFAILFTGMWLILHHLTDSPVPGWDSFITSLSIIATWMLARKIYEHWYLWIVVNGVAVVLFLTRGLYPTVALYAVYCVMSFVGLKEWRKTIK